jgi:hypothetical protein
VTDAPKTDELLKAIKEKDKTAVNNLATPETIAPEHVIMARSNYDKTPMKFLSIEEKIVGILTERAKPDIIEQAKLQCDSGRYAANLEQERSSPPRIEGRT